MALLPVITLLIGYKQIQSCFAWHPFKEFANEKSDSTIRIITWNIKGMFGLSGSNYKQIRLLEQIPATIKELNPDIICLQEFNIAVNPKDPHSKTLNSFADWMPYHYFASDFYNGGTGYYMGSIIFSKYKMLDSGKVKFRSPLSESLIYTDVQVGDSVLRIYTTHMQSFQFKPSDFAAIQKLKNQDDGALEASEITLEKMVNAFGYRGGQADTVRRELDKCNIPFIITGDFNDVPNSYTYFKVKGNLQDAFLKSSFGIGRTFNSISPTLRIDYIMPDNHFNIHQFGMIDEGLSDHHLLITDISIKK